jgi:hypothetical protein
VVRVNAVNELSLKYTELDPMALEVEIALERYGRCKAFIFGLNCSTIDTVRK